MKVFTLLAACAAVGCAATVNAPVLADAMGDDHSVALVLDGGASVDFTAPEEAPAPEVTVPKAPPPGVTVTPADVAPRPNRGRRSRRP